MICVGTSIGKRCEPYTTQASSWGILLASSYYQHVLLNIKIVTLLKRSQLDGSFLELDGKELDNVLG
eukprot:3388135-Amphidinium_carterae.1